MKRTCPLTSGGLAVTALLLILLFSGCGDDKSASPTPSPKLTMSLDDDQGIVTLTVHNSGGGMSTPSLFCANFTDGKCDSLFLTLAAGDSLKCQLSNIHGGVTVTNEGWDLEATMDDCLVEYFETIMGSINLNSLLPRPLGQQTVLLCTYSIYVDNLTVGQITAELLPRTGGLTLKHTYSNITGGLSGPSPSWACADITGDIAISSIVVLTEINISEGDDPTVTLGASQATISGFDVNVDGLFGVIVGWIVGWFDDYFTSGIEVAIQDAITNQVGPYLGELVIPKSSCAE